MSDIYEVRASWTDRETGEVEEWVETYAATKSIAESYISSKQKARKSVPKQYLPDYDEPVLTIHRVEAVLSTEAEHVPVYHTLRNNTTDQFSHMTYALVNVNDNEESIMLPYPIAEILFQAAQKSGSLRVSILEDEDSGSEQTLFSSTNHALLQSVVDAEG